MPVTDASSLSLLVSVRAGHFELHFLSQPKRPTQLRVEDKRRASLKQVEQIFRVLHRRGVLHPQNDGRLVPADDQVTAPTPRRISAPEESPHLCASLHASWLHMPSRPRQTISNERMPA